MRQVMPRIQRVVMGSGFMWPALDASSIDESGVMMMPVCVCVRVCVCARARACVCMYVCVCPSDRPCVCVYHFCQCVYHLVQRTCQDEQGSGSKSHLA